MADEEIKLSGLEAKEDRLSVSGAESAPFRMRAVSTSDSTQGEEIIVQPDNLRIISGKSQAQSSNVTVHDVAAFILQQHGEMTAMKLQKLVYYSQAWSLVWDEEPLFSEPIEAWANGPVVRSLYVRHQGTFKVRNWDGDPTKLNEDQRETILKVLEFYGPMPAQVLSDLTHSEAPWLNARSGLTVGDRGSRVISHSEMAEYYSSLA